jgi:hypothetical protein
MHSRLLKFTHGQQLGWCRSGLLAGALFASPVLNAAIVDFIQNALDDSTGATINAVASNQSLNSASTYSTNWAPATWGSPELRFTHWTQNSSSTVTLRDAWGLSLNRVSILLLENTTATAHYLPIARNTDSDALPDWYEILYFDNLSRNGDADFDGDGRTDAAEYAAGSAPNLPNQTREGGVSSAQSGLITCNFAGFATYRILSSPSGLVNEVRTVTPGTVVSTPNFSTTPDFAYWTLDGLRQQDNWVVP